MGEAVSVPLRDIQIDTKVLPRVGKPDEDLIRRWADIIDEMPPIKLQQGTNILLDGLGRMEAAYVAGRESIQAEYIECSEQEAMMLAIAYNSKHGRPLRNKEIRDRVVKMKKRYPDMTTDQIAKGVGVHPVTIWRWLKAGEEGEAIDRLSKPHMKKPQGLVFKDEQARRLLAALTEISTTSLTREEFILRLPPEKRHLVPYHTEVASDWVESLEKLIRGWD